MTGFFLCRRGAAAAVAAALALMAACTTNNASGSGGVALERVFAEQPLANPVHLAPPGDSSGRLAVVEQAGRILWLRSGGVQAEGVLLDIRDRVNGGGEEGLLSIAFHPQFAGNGYFFVYYSAAGPRRSVISRFQDSGGTADAATEHIVLEVAQPYSNHNAGQLAFGPDGYLYVALGDGGSGGDPQNNGQNPNTLLGSILRIDVSAATGYAIPGDNPFAGGGGRPEIWAYGLRNPWRFSFDRETGALYAGDVGQNRIEEVDRIVRGGNYGWRTMEGSACYQPADGCPTTGLTGPLAEYDRSNGYSVTGGFVYRGSAIPGLVGRYLFADYGSGRIWSISTAGEGLRPLQLLLDTSLSISSFGEDEAGELYVLHLGGEIHKLVPPP